MLKVRKNTQHQIGKKILMIKLLILDVDGVLTDGNKIYDINHTSVYKKFNDRDFTAIKRFKATGINVVLLSGDMFNKAVGEKRNIDFYCSRNKDLSLDKSRFLKKFKELYNIPIKNMAFIGDDFFDLSIIKKLKYTYCPSNSPQIVKDNCLETLNINGGEGIVAYLYDLLLINDVIEDASEEKVNELDKKETTSQEMS